MGLLDLSFLEQIAIASKHKGKPVAKKAAKKATAKKRGPNAPVDLDKFTLAYEAALKSGQTTKELAESLGMSVQSVQARKVQYKKTHNINFKPLKRGAKGPKYTEAQIKAFQKRVGG
jgi:hypothetical protein